MAYAVLPGGPLQIMFSFDTTVSMTSYVDQVKARLQDMVQKLQTDIPGISIALFAHGDYYQKRYDNKSPYVTKFIDFTQDIASLCNFINSAEPTEGGDWKECYELVLKEAGEKLTWHPDANKVVVMIGDARPHEIDDPPNKDKISWKEETQKLLKQGIRTYGVYCETNGSESEDQKFFTDLANIGEGSFLKLEHFGDIFDFMMAICYREKGEEALQVYEQEVRTRDGKGVNKDINNMFTTLKKSASNASTMSLKSTATPGTASGSKKTSSATAGGLLKGVKQLATKRTGRAKKSPIKRKQLQKGNQEEVKLTRTGTRDGTKQNSLTKKLRRENVPESNFRLRDRHWSKFELVIQSTVSMGNRSEYTKRLPAKGYRKRQIFQGQTNVPALYEFAVLPRPHSRKYKVYTIVSKGFSSKICWEKQLLKGQALQKQIELVLKQHAYLFVRRMTLRTNKRQYDIVKDSMSIYDYAWESQRRVQKSTVLISDSMEVD